MKKIELVYSDLAYKKIGFLLTLSFFMFASQALAQTSDWYISGANYARYYRFEQTKQDSAATRFQFDVYFGNFYAGAWYEVKHPQSNAVTTDSITQRYFGWDDGGLSIHAGDFYQVFDRGLILNAYRDEDVNIDIPLDGIRVSGKYDLLDFDALAATSKTKEGDKPSIRGARAKLKPFSFFHFGGAYVRLIETNFDFGDIRTNLTEVNGRLNYKYFDAYVEYAMRDGYNINYLVVPPLKSNQGGDGTYASFNTHYWKFSGLFEYKNYKFLIYPTQMSNFNQPPAVNHQERSIQSIYNTTGERGWRVGLNFAQDNYWGASIDYAEAKSRDVRSIYMNEFYAEIRGAYYQENQFIISFDRLNHTEKNEILPKLEMSYTMTDIYSMTLTGNLLKYELRDDQGDSTDYTEKYINLDINRTEKITLSVGGSWSDRKWGDIPDADPAQMSYIGVTLRLTNNDLALFYGGQRGGYICAGGVCTFKPTFRGIRATLLSRF